MALQVVQLFKNVFDSIGLDLYLVPYRCIPNRTGADRAPGGIIEVIPNCKSRDQLGKQGSDTLMQHFTQSYGVPGGAQFAVAARNFSRSLAAYAVVCHVLQIKDRHNGNLMVDDDGHVIHIDFGFLLGRSPGGDLGFEDASFKLTQEMIDVLGGSREVRSA